MSKRGLLEGCHADTLDFCEHCVFSKHKRVNFSAAVHNTENILNYVHANLWGPSRKPSNGGARYMLTIIDNYSLKFDYIFSSINQMHLIRLRSGRQWLRNKPRER